MAGISYPLWYTLKNNVKTILTEIAASENAISTARNFEVAKDRWRPYIESQHNKALANILVQNVNVDTERSGNRVNSIDDISVIVDMYAIGKAGETLPTDEVAADRLDLLIAQVREGLTRLDKIDFLFTRDPDYGFPIERKSDFTLTYYDQEATNATGQYAPARWSFTVAMPFIPNDERTYYDLDELNLTVKDDTLNLYSLKFDYTS